MAKTATVRQLQVASLFMAGGWMPSGASSMTGNLSQESGVNLPSVFRTGRLDHGSQGLPQWRLSRLTDYCNYVKAKHHELAGQDDSPGSALWAQYGRLDYQVEYIMVEVARDYPKLDAALRKGGSVSALTAMICWQFERPSKTYANLDNRIAQALLVFNSLPAGARSANKTEIVAALDEQADKHTSTAATGAAAATAAVAVGGSVGLTHIAHSIAWWEWGVFGLASFVIVCGIASMVSNASSATLVRNAKAMVDPETEKHDKTDPVKPPSEPVPLEPPDAATIERMNAEQAHQQEQAAIDAAMQAAQHPVQQQQAQAGRALTMNLEPGHYEIAGDILKAK